MYREDCSEIMNKTQQLQEHLDANLRENQGVWYIEYRGRGGWWAVPDSPRWFGDDGMFLGPNAGIAKRTIGLMF